MNEWEKLIKAQIHDDLQWSDQYKTKAFSDYVKAKIAETVKHDLNSSYGTVAAHHTAQAWPRTEKEKPKSKVTVHRSHECPSGTVHVVQLNEEGIGAYIFSEYKHGDDWYVDHSGTLLIKDKVLTDLLVRFGN